MYPVFPPDPASIVELDWFRGGNVLIFPCFFVGFTRRLAVGTGGLGNATLTLVKCFLKRLGQ